MKSRRNAGCKPFWWPGLQGRGNGGNGRRRGNGKGVGPNGDRRKALFEPVEPRILLSGDLLTVDVDDTLSEGIQRFGSVLDQFLENEALLETQLPVLVRSGGDTLLDVSTTAPTIGDLFSVETDINRDGIIGSGDNVTAKIAAAENELAGFDANGDGSVDLREVLENQFIQKIAQGVMGKTNQEFVDFLQDELNEDNVGLASRLKDSGSPATYFDLTIGNAVVDSSTDGQVSFNIDLDLTFFNELAIDLGFRAEEMGIVSSAMVMVEGEISFNLQFGALTSGEGSSAADFFVAMDGPLTMEVFAQDTDLAGDIRVGFLGAEVSGGSVVLETNMDVDFNDPAHAGKVGFSPGQYGVAGTDAIAADYPLADSAFGGYASLLVRIGGALGGGGSDAREVRFDTSTFDASDLGGIESQVQSALDDAGFAGLINASTATGRLVLSLAGDAGDLDITSLGFSGNEHYSVAGDGSIDASIALNDAQAAGLTGTLKFLLSENHDLPMLVSVDAGAANTVDSLIAQINLGLIAAGFGHVVAGKDPADGTITIRSTKSAPSSLEITRTLTVDSRITRSDLVNEEVVDLLTARQRSVAFDGSDSTTVRRIPSGDMVLTIQGHGLTVGDQVVYSSGGGDNIGNLRDGSLYYVIWVNGASIKLSEMEGTISPVQFAGVGSGTEHQLILSRFDMDLPIEVKQGLVDGNADPFEPSAVVNFDTPTHNPFEIGSRTDANGEPLLKKDGSDTRFNFKIDLTDITGGYSKGDLLNFTNMNASSFIGLLREFGRYLDDLGSSEDFTAYSIPFAMADLGDVLDLDDMWTDALLKDDLDNNDSGDDIYKLLDSNNNPTFDTAQELAGELGRLLHPGLTAQQQLVVIGAAYDTGTGDLTYNIDMENPLPDLEVPIDFSLPTDPLKNVRSDSTVTLGATAGVGMVLGVNLGETPGEYLTEDTTLAELGIGVDDDGDRVNIDPSVTGASSARTVYGRLTDDATFDLIIRGSTYEVTVAHSEVDDNITDDDPDKDPADYLASRIRGALTSAVEVTGTNADGSREYGPTTDLASSFGIEVSAEDSRITLHSDTDIFSVEVSDGDPAMNKIGFPAERVADEDGTGYSLTTTKDAPKLVGVLTSDARFTIDMGSDNLDVFTVTVEAGDAGSNKNIVDLVNDVNNALKTPSLVSGAVSQFQLTTDATFSVSVNGQPAVAVTVQPGDLSAPNSNLEDLVQDINQAIGNTDLDGLIEAQGYTWPLESYDSAEEFFIRIKAIDNSVEQFELTVAAGDPAETVLGLPHHHLCRDISDQMEAVSQGDRLVLASSGGSGFTVSAPSGSELGLGDVQVSDTDDLIIHLSDGSRYRIDLNDAVDIGDVIDLINEQTVKSGSAPGTPGEIAVKVNDPEKGTGFELTERNWVSSNGHTFYIEPVNASTMAVGLGLVRIDVTRDANDDGVINNLDADGVIDGAPIKGPELADRVFVNNAVMDADFSLTTPARALTDITIDAADASRILSSDLTVDYAGQYIEIAGAAGFQAGTFRIISVEADTVDDTLFVATLSGEAGVKGSTGGTGEILGIQGSGGLGFVGVSLYGSGQLTGSVNTTLNNDGANGIDSITHTKPVVEGTAAAGTFGGIVLNLDVGAPLSSMVSGAQDPTDPRIEITVSDLGDPFHEEQFAGAVLREADRIEVPGDQTAWFTKGAVVRVETEPGTIISAEVAGSNFDADSTDVTFRSDVLKGYLGHISSNGNFSIAIDGEAAVPVTVGQVDVEDNDSVFDLAADINAALDQTALGGRIVAEVVDGRFILKAADAAVTGFTLTSAADDPMVTEIGFEPSMSSTDGGSAVSIEAVRNWGLLLAGLTAAVPPHISVSTPGRSDLSGLNDLLYFDEIDYEDIVEGLGEASGFLEQMETYGDLSDPLLLANQSVSDLMGLARRFDGAVRAARENPAGTLQALQGKLNEAFGISNGESITLSLDETGGTTPALRFDMVLSAGMSEALDITLLDINLLDLVDGIDLDALGRQGRVELTQSGDGLEIIGDNGGVFTIDGDQTDWIKVGEKVLFDAAGDTVETRITSVFFDGDAATVVTVQDEVLPAGLSRLEVSDEFVDLVAANILGAEGNMVLDLDLGIDLGDPVVRNDAGEVYIYNTTGITGALTGTGEDLDFGAGMGPFTLEVSGGSASLDVVFAAGADLAGMERKPMGDVDYSEGSPDISSQVDEHTTADLPAGFNGIDVGTFTLSSNPGLVLPDGFRADFVNEYTGEDSNLFDNILLAVDGVDLFLSGLQDLLDGEVFSFRLPLIGDQLADGARFIEDMRDDFVEPFRGAVATADDLVTDFADPDKNIVSGFLVDLLGPEGIDLLQPVEGVDNPLSLSDYIDFTTSLGGPISDTFVQWNMTIGSSLFNVGADIGFDLGIPGLNLKTDGDIKLDINWELAFGFGISFTDGFYLDISDGSELELNLEVTLPASITGTLGFLRVIAEDKDVDGDGDSTGLSATFGINIINRQDLELLGHTDELPPGLEISDFMDDKLTINELFGQLGLDVVLGARAAAELGMTLEVSGDLIGESTAAGFPRITSDFIFDWEVEDQSLTELMANKKRGDSAFTDVIKEGMKLVAFQDVNLDLGSYVSDVLGPIMDKIQDVTEPVQPVIDILTEPIPVISDLGPDLTLLDIAAMAGRVDKRLLYAIADVITLINSIPDPSTAESLLLPFGDFTIYSSESGLTGSELWSDDFNIAGDTEKLLNDSRSLLKSFDDFDDAMKDLSGGKKSKGILSKMRSAGDFAFPIFEDPSQVFGLLTGTPAVLITYDMDPLEFEFEWSQFFSVYGPLGISINMEFSATIDFAFGYDTLGIQEFVESDFTNPLLLLDGFYVSDTDLATGDYGTDVPELVFSGGLSAAAELNLVIARAGVGGGIYAQIEFDLFDPDRDGRVRIREILGNVENEWNYGNPVLSPLAIFDVHGEMWAKLYAFLEIDFVIFSFGIDFDITPPLTLLEFDIPFTRAPNLATETNGDLQINAGENAADRINYNTADTGETFTLWGGADSLDVNVNAFGFTQQYELGGSTIYISGGEGDDVFDLRGILNPGVTAVIDGGPGDDLIYAGAGTAIIRGGEGDDVIFGGSGDDEIYGGLGVDTIDAGGGNDLVFGDEGRKSRTSVRAFSGPSDGGDVIDGGSGSDIIFGGGGADIITGGDDSDSPDDDIIVGDGGQITFNVAAPFEKEQVPQRGQAREVSGTVRDFYFGNDFLSGGGGADAIYGGKGNDVIDGGPGGDTLFGEVGFDTVRGGDGWDTIFGDGWRITDDGLDPVSGGEADQLFGGGGSDTIYGTGGADTIHGGDDGDTIYGGTDADEIHGDGGSDTIYGQGGPDTIYGGLGHDARLDGGEGSDVVFGGEKGSGEAEGNDTIYGGLGSDLLDGQGGSDTYVLDLRGADNSSLNEVYDSGILPEDTDSMRVNGTDFDDQFLLRAGVETGSKAFVALLNDYPDAGVFDNLERINYEGLERLVVNGLGGSDRFAVDDIRAEATINGGIGEDFFQVAQLYRSERTFEAANVDPEDVFATIQVTRGFLSNGITQPLTINGGADDDEFMVFHNLAVLTLNGGTGDDLFTVRAFALVGSQDSPRERTDIHGGGGADLIQYAVNAPVNIDGGDGLDTLIVIGTEFADDFVITEDGVFGAGLNVNFVGIEVLRVDGAEGDDRFFVLSTSGNFTTEIIGGLGSDTFNMAGDTPPVISNDLLGHSGIITHSVEITGSDYDGIKVEGVSANIADNDEPAIRITQVEGSTTVGEDGLTDTYTVVLARQPLLDVYVKVLAPMRTPEEEAMESFNFQVSSRSGRTEPDGSSTTLIFTKDDWYLPQQVTVSVPATVIISEQDVVSADKATLRAADGAFADPGNPGTDLDLSGMKVRIVSGPGAGQTRIIKSNTGDTLTLTRAWDTIPVQTGDFPPTFEVVKPFDDEAVEGVTFGAINHVVISEETVVGGDGAREAFSVGGNTISASTRIMEDGEVKDAADRTLVAEEGTFNLYENGNLKDLVGLKVKITDGPGEGQVRVIESFTHDTLTLSTQWDAGDMPDSRSRFTLLEPVDLFAGLDLENAIVRITEGAGLGQSRLIESWTPGEITVFSDWDNDDAPDAGSKFVVVKDDSIRNMVDADVTDTFRDFRARFPIAVGGLVGATVTITGGKGAGESREITANTVDTITVDTPWSVELDDTSEYEVTRNGEVVTSNGMRVHGMVTSLATRTFHVSGAGFPETDTTDPGNEVNGLRAAVIEVVGGAGIGQVRVIESSTSETITVTTPWDARLDETSEFVISRYDGLALPSVKVRVEDNDAAGVVITRSENTTRVIEGAEISFYGAKDTYSLVLARRPEFPDLTDEADRIVTVTLGLDGQLNINSDDPRFSIDADGQTMLTFHVTDWDDPVVLTVTARDDDTPEGFHHGYITHSVSSADVDVVLSTTQQFLIPENDPQTSVILMKKLQRLYGVVTSATPDTISDENAGLPTGGNGLAGFTVEITDGTGTGQARVISSNTSDSLTILGSWDTVPDATSEYVILPTVVVTETRDGITTTRDPERYELSSSTVIFLDPDGAPEEVTGRVVVLYPYLVAGYDEVEVDRVVADIGDNETPGVLITETAVSTDLIEISDRSGVVTGTVQTGADRLIFGQFGNADFAGRTIRIVSGTGVDQSRTVVANTETAALVDEAWLEAPDSSSTFEIVEETNLSGQTEEQILLSGTVSHGLEKVLAGSFDYDDLDGKLITITAGAGAGQSNTVASHLAVGDLEFLILENAWDVEHVPDSSSEYAIAITLNGVPWDDTYSVVLTKKPVFAEGTPIDQQIVRVVVSPRDTRTTREKLVTNIKQVAVSDQPGARINDDGTVTLTFTADNWNVAQTVYVTAIDDDLADGGDTKVFAPMLHTVNDIMGPLFLSGAGGAGSLEGLTPPVMLPADPFDPDSTPETNVKGSTGTVHSISGTDFTVATADIDEYDGDLLDRTVEITEVAQGGPEEIVGRFRRVLNFTDNGDGTTTLLLNDPWGLDQEDLDRILAYAITNESLNFFVDEDEQVDILTVFHEDSVANNVGSLVEARAADKAKGYEKRIIGLGMGPDVEIGGAVQPGGITYGGMEIAEINLGAGKDTFTVETTHRRDDFQTWTMLNTGPGDDTVIISLEQIDHVLDSGVVGEATDVNAPDILVTADALPDGNVYSGLMVKITAGTGAGQTRVIASHSNNVIKTDRPWETLPDTTSRFEILHQGDGAFALNAQEGDDRIFASDIDRFVPGSVLPDSTLPLVIFGWDGSDTIVGGQADDIIFGDRGRVDYVDESGDNIKVVTRIGEAPDNITGAVTGASGTTLTVDQVLPVEDEGLRGLVVWINEGTGAGQSRLIVSNTDSEITIDSEWSVAPDATSGFRVTGIPSDQTDGVFRDAAYMFTADHGIGGDDHIWGGLGEDVLMGGAGGDFIDGGVSADLIFGDSVKLDRTAGRAGDFTNPRFRALIPGETAMYGTDDRDHVDDSTDYVNPDSAPAWADWDILLSETERFSEFGDDRIAGGADDDMIFGQRGSDTLHGDGMLDDNGVLLALPDTAGDGEDYVEGNDGNDTVYGGLGQDDLIGGSSGLFSLVTPDLRGDGADTIFGGNGDLIERNNMGDNSADGHARDADMILGDNGNIFRLVDPVTGQLLIFNYDNYGAEKIIPRVSRLIDYSPGGPDFAPNNGAGSDVGAADEIHGESGDDFIYGMVGDDILFGEGQDDDMVGGYGNDWISGGTGQDGVLGDDGRIWTSRNGLSEDLYGIAAIPGDQLNLYIATGGDIQQSTINVPDVLKKTVNLTPFMLGDAESPENPQYLNEFDPQFADDIIYGGLGSDFLHGGDGDDAISGAEALPVFHDNPINPGDVLGYNPATEEFSAYNENDPWHKVFVDENGIFTTPGSGMEFLLNFDPGEGPSAGVYDSLEAFSDGNDIIFGDLGNDWLVGGTGKDHIYGGRGDDLLNADDDHESGGVTNRESDTHPSYEDIAYGGAGRDVLLANTGGDRLIDWAGEFNSYIVPFSPFGISTVSRQLQPALIDYLYQLSASDGADPTRAADTGSDPDRNGEPYGELGLVNQKDPDWQDQTGGPGDPQPGNDKGSKDVLKSASPLAGSETLFFDDTTGTLYDPDTGVTAADNASLPDGAVDTGSGVDGWIVEV